MESAATAVALVRGGGGGGRRWAAGGLARRHQQTAATDGSSVASAPPGSRCSLPPGWNPRPFNLTPCHSAASWWRQRRSCVTTTDTSFQRPYQVEAASDTISLSSSYTHRGQFYSQSVSRLFVLKARHI